MAAPERPGEKAHSARAEPVDATLISWRFVVAGCLAAVLAESLLSFLPVKGIVSAVGLLPSAILYITQAVFAGALGALLFGMPPESRSWKRLFAAALFFGPAWVWVAPAVLLNYHDSGWALIAGAVGAAVLAICMRQFVPPQAGSLSADRPLPPREERELFSASLQSIPWDWHASAIAVCAFAAFTVLRAGENSLACVFAVACAFLFASQWASAREDRLPPWQANRRAVRRLLRATVPAVIVTMIILMMVFHRDTGGAAYAKINAAAGATPEGATSKTAANSAGFGFDGYESIVLWPEPPKKVIVAPVDPAYLTPALRIKKPLTIRFTGTYWYFQPPATQPGPHPHVARGNPLNLNISSDDFFPLTMEAHQNFGAPIRLSPLREIDVGLANRDNRPGLIAVGVVLTDSASPGKSALYLGQQPVESSELYRFREKTAPAEETLQFAIPAHAPIRKFDEITLIVFPDTSRMKIGARIAIEEFDFLPR
ncbi:MAG: hypothetical protein WBE76_16330 [Terracidiphilus sp.]